MFDVDNFVCDCVDTLDETDCRRAIREVLERAMVNPTDVASSLDHSEGGLNILFRSPQLTILNVVWAPHMSLQPHDHRMWAAIGIYAGQEDNTFFRRQPSGLTRSGGKELRSSDVVVLGNSTIHGVSNPSHHYTGAVHIYGGDFVATPRSQWDPKTFEEQPYSLDGILSQFAAANAEAKSLE
jgi:predicted metal-dependent enzyme (double-stranded beta helix superfamily)